MEWLINEKNRTFYGMKLPTGFQLIGQTTLKQYQDWLVYFDQQSRLESHYISRKTMRAYARVGVSIMSTTLEISSKGSSINYVRTLGGRGVSQNLTLLNEISKFYTIKV